MVEARVQGVQSRGGSKLGWVAAVGLLSNFKLRVGLRNNRFRNPIP